LRQPLQGCDGQPDRVWVTGTGDPHEVHAVTGQRLAVATHNFPTHEIDRCLSLLASGVVPESHGHNTPHNSKRANGDEVRVREIIPGLGIRGQGWNWYSGTPGLGTERQADSKHTLVRRQLDPLRFRCRTWLEVTSVESEQRIVSPQSGSIVPGRIEPAKRQILGCVPVLRESRRFPYCEAVFPSKDVRRRRGS
jgi:hypothetical protein